MKKVDSGELVKYIEDAEDWLKKAKDEYNQANPIRGGLILSLAQAEVKHAWELSHNQYVSEVKKPSNNRKNKFFVPAAASIILILAVTLLMEFDKISLPSKATPQLIEPDLARNKNTVTQSLAPQKNGTNNLIANIVLEKQQIVQAQSTLPRENEDSKMDKYTSENIVDQNQTVNMPSSTDFQDEAEASDSKIAAATTEVIRERVSVQNQQNLQPVSQLSIDEETLTKEASRSLRNGK